MFVLREKGSETRQYLARLGDDSYRRVEFDGATVLSLKDLETWMLSRSRRNLLPLCDKLSLEIVPVRETARYVAVEPAVS